MGLGRSLYNIKVSDLISYNISMTKFHEIRKTLGLQQTWQQGHTVETIWDAMINLHAMYPNAGSREMVNLLFHEHNMSVAR